MTIIGIINLYQGTDAKAIKVLVRTTSTKANATTVKAVETFVLVLATLIAAATRNSVENSIPNLLSPDIMSSNETPYVITHLSANSIAKIAAIIVRIVKAPVNLVKYVVRSNAAIIATMLPRIINLSSQSSI